MSGKTILVAGAGGNIGSHLTQILARMEEVGRVVLCDRDVYELRNARNQNIRLRDLGKPKVQIQARRMVEIRPDLQVEAIHAPLENLPLGLWRVDLILACLDSRAARQTVNERAGRLAVPWIDSGVLGSEWLARVNVYVPAGDAPCLECAWSNETYQQLERQYPCGAASTAAPNGASSELGALAAAMLALECRKMLAGDRDCAAIGRQVTFHARWHQFSVTSFRRNPTCRFDHAAWHIQPLRCHTRKTRVEDLLAMAETVRVPGQRFVRRLVCTACGHEKRLFHLAASLGKRLQRCGRCRQTMMAPGFDIVESLSPALPAGARNLTLEEAGLRYGDVLEAGDRYCEISRECGDGQPEMERAQILSSVMDGGGAGEGAKCR
jgi:molybdopterin/thiamine biosynthesis adenylyltransferase